LNTVIFWIVRIRMQAAGNGNFPWGRHFSLLRSYNFAEYFKN
jgi:hypothetical protein